MGVYGRSRHSWEFATYCDFGDIKRRSRIGLHYSRKAAENSFKRWKPRYSWLGQIGNHHLYRMWQESRSGEIINDTGSPLVPVVTR